MKKLLFLLSFLIALGNYSFAQKSKKGAESDVDPPTKVLKAYTTKYKLGKKPVWTQEEDNYRVDFKYNSINMAVCYDQEGKMLYTEKELLKNQYNKSALKYIQENYAGYKVTSMRKRDTYDKKTSFMAMLRKGREMLEVEFDKKGGYIKDTDKTPVTVSKKKGKKSGDDDEETNDDEDKPVKKKDTKVKAKKSGDDEDTDEEEATPAPKKEKAKPAPKKTNDDEEEATPAPKKEKAKPAPKKTTDDDEDVDAGKPAPKKEKAKPAKKEKKKSNDDEDDDE